MARTCACCFCAAIDVDDGIVITRTTSPDMHSFIKAAVYAAYPQGMICEETADGRVIDILENRVMIDVNDIHILFRPKNLPAHLVFRDMNPCPNNHILVCHYYL